ncbi:MAG TPA: VTC domain-containing protein [Candidatus Acidoferrales bacterium]|nr:VTC domain-containing protein [Candidatus Acidoferrales bacterium]
MTLLTATRVTSQNEPRKEHRFLVNEAVGRLALRTAGTYMPLDREDRPYQWSTTVYCDTYDWRVLKAEKEGHATQLRLREYHRTRPNEALASDSLFVEMKDDSPGAAMKERYLVPTAEVMGYLRCERTLESDMDALTSRVAELLKIGMHPVVATQYNRIAYASPDGTVRITADHNLMYLAIPWQANTDDAVPSRLGPVIGREAGVLIEVKWFDSLPHWADELYGYIHDHMVNERPSKYVVAMRHLLGEEERSA